ncbi:MAG: hypothetical protein ACLT29_04515 [Ruminococcus callidus]
MELAAGAAYCGARTMVTMKQVGLNVASDPLMSLAYIGVKGGMVVLDSPARSLLRQSRTPGGLLSSCRVLTRPGQEAYDMIRRLLFRKVSHAGTVSYHQSLSWHASIQVKDK